MKLISVGSLAGESAQVCGKFLEFPAWDAWDLHSSEFEGCKQCLLVLIAEMHRGLRNEP
jgi:hypothetical protein